MVLGGTGGIGSSIADAFEGEGAAVCRHSFDVGEYKADLRDTTQTKKLIEKVLQNFQTIDVVVNCVSSPLRPASFERKTWDDFLMHILVQLKSVVETTHLVLDAMKRQKRGRIINIITSAVKGVAPSHMSDYVTAKYAVWGITKALAKELARYSITVNAVSPGFIESDFTKDMPPKTAELALSQTPSGRLTVPQDIAGVVLFLASDEAGHVTGENIVVAGGSTL